jgi:hydroxymethylglutaryl-CoA synthase
MIANIQSYGVAFPSLRLAAGAYRDAWGGCSARGLRRKPFCAFDEDAVTLAVAAARSALDKAGIDLAQIGALFVGTTTWPYEEKPAAASLVTALLGRSDLRTVELRGSRQAGLQALVAAAEYVASHPGRYALAVAADAPMASPEVPYEHALAAGAAAFVVGGEGGIAVIEADAAATVETFGSRYRRHGEAHLKDLELRVDDDRKSLDAVCGFFNPGAVRWVATGAPIDLADRAAKRFGGASDQLWPELGDMGAAGTPVALAHCLDEASVGDRIVATAVGAGGTALAVMVTSKPRDKAGVTAGLAAGRDVDYLTYLKHRRLIGATRSSST